MHCNLCIRSVKLIENMQTKSSNFHLLLLLGLALLVSAAMGVPATINTLSESTGQLVGFEPTRTFYIVTVSSAHATIGATTLTTTPVGAFVTVNHMGATTPVPLEYGINKVLDLMIEWRVYDRYMMNLS